MTFKEYFLKESPDLVYTPKKRALNWYSRDAVTFGTLWGLIDISPFFIRSIKKGLSHYDMLEDLIIEIESSYHLYEDKLGRKPTVQEVEELYKKKLTWNRRWTIHPRDASRIAKEIANSKHLMKHIQKETLYNNIDRAARGESKGKTEIERDLSNKTRTEIYRNAGRVWPTHKIISFWLAEDQLTPQILDETFNSLGIKDKLKYLVDVVNMKELDKEETNKKVLPSYKDYKKKSGSDNQLSKEDQKKAAEFMAKQHGVAGAMKAKWGQDIPLVGANKVAKYTPIDVRQKAQTSESKICNLQS